MPEVIITYENLYEILRREKYRTELQKTQTQLKNVLKILKELYEKRENKIIQFALFCSRSNNAQDTSTMLPEEFALYSQLKETLDNYRLGILNNILQNKLPSLSLSNPKDLKGEEKTDSLSIQVLKDIPEFVGPDLSVYGPFKVGEKQQIPTMIAQMLIDTEQAKNETS